MYSHPLSNPVWGLKALLFGGLAAHFDVIYATAPGAFDCQIQRGALA
jgi:hypothetical protein